MSAPSVARLAADLLLVFFTVCDLDYDPFRYMQDHNKKYGWTVSLYEYEATIPTLWEKTKGARAPALSVWVEFVSLACCSLLIFVE